MNAMSHPIATNRDFAAEELSDARTELAHHYFDLRIHSLVMLLSAAAAGYCGISVLNINDSVIAGKALGSMGPHDLMSVGALAIFAAFAVFCLVEAHRGWKKAVIAGAENEAHAKASPHPIRQSLVAAE